MLYFSVIVASVTRSSAFWASALVAKVPMHKSFFRAIHGFARFPDSFEIQPVPFARFLYFLCAGSWLLPQYGQNLAPSGSSALHFTHSDIFSLPFRGESGIIKAQNAPIVVCVGFLYAAPVCQTGAAFITVAYFCTTVIVFLV